MARGSRRPARDRNKGRKNQRLYDRATTNVEMQDQSQVNLLQQQLQDAQRDYLRESQAAQSVWGGGAEEIRDLPRPQFGQIGDEFNQSLESVAPMFGGDEFMPESEQAAGNALGLAYGESGNTMLANIAAREGLARSSAGRQANLEGKYTRDALIQRMEDAVRGYNDRLGQVRADDPWQIKQEVGDLRDQRLEQQLVKQKMESEAAFNEWLQGYIGGQDSSGRPPRGPGGGGGGGGGRPPGATPPVNPTTGVPEGWSGLRRPDTDASGVVRPAHWANWSPERRQRWRQAQRPQYGRPPYGQGPYPDRSGTPGTPRPGDTIGPSSPPPVYGIQPDDDPLYGINPSPWAGYGG